MTDEGELTERREHKRHQLKDHSFVANVNRNKIGKIINISMGGFALRYIDTEKWPDNSFKSGIVLSENFYMENIPLRTISDSLIDKGLPSSITERRRHIQFGELTPGQMSQLEYFIQNNRME